MAEYAEYQLQWEMRRGSYGPRGSGPTERNPITATCPVCDKGCRSLAGDPNGGLKAHMKAKHKGVATCIQGNCMSLATVAVQVSASSNRGEDTEPATVMMCRECAYPYSAGDVVGAGFMGVVK